MAMDKDKLAAMVAAARAKIAAKAAASASASEHSDVHAQPSSANTTYEYLGKQIAKPEFEELVDSLTEQTPEVPQYTTAAGKVVELNAAQLEYVEKIKAGEDVVLIGKAGTGKTTSAGVGMTEMIKAGKITPMRNSTKHLQAGLPGVAILSFTNKAVNNIRHQMPADLNPHCLTVHKVLEFKPVKYEIEDKETGLMKITMRFEPARNQYNPLPSDLKMIVFEESSMISVELHQLLIDALPHKCQLVYLGDIRQLPPVMGSAILGFKMNEIPVVELTEVYRQALLSPILRAALAVDSGEYERFDPSAKIKNKATGKWEWPALKSWNESGDYGSLTIHPWQKDLSPDLALMTAIKFMTTMEATGHQHYNPQDDIILCPFNKAFGTIELNKGIAQYLGVKRGAVVHEIVAGFQKHYLAVGDRVLYNKEDAFIVNIARNGEYMGAKTQPASVNLNRWGHIDTSLTEEEEKKAIAEDTDFELLSIEKFLESSAEQIEERVTSASHIITIKYAWDMDGEEDENTIELEKAAEVNNLLGGYAITVHKAQGSEYGKVFLLLHASHNMMISRELLYTAMTRAKEHLYIICEPGAIVKGIKAQRIKGDTLAEKAEFFKGKMEGYLDITTDRLKVAAAIKEKKDAVQTAIKKALENLSAHYPNKPALVLRAVTYVDTGNSAGTAQLERAVVNINPLYLEWDEAHILQDTVPHEVAHIAAYQWFGDAGHGTAWKQLCVEAGGTGDVYHDMGAARSIRSGTVGSMMKGKR